MGVELPEVLRGLVPLDLHALEDYVLQRIGEFAQLFAAELHPEAPAPQVDAAFHQTLSRLQLHDRNQPQEQAARLRFVHRCRFLGCRKADCSMCKNNPHKRCSAEDSFDECYADNQVLRAKCEADVSVELVSALTGKPIDCDGQEVQVCVVDGEVRSSGSGRHEAQQVNARELLRSDLGIFLLGSQSGARRDSQGRLILSLQDGCCRLPDVSVTDKNDSFHLDGQTFGSFRLMARAVRRDAFGSVVLMEHIAPALSQTFIVKTQRALNDYRKTEYPHFQEELTRLKFIGGVTAQRLRDIQAHVSGIPFPCIETVEQLKQLILYVDQDRQIEAKLLDMLNMKGKHKHKWEYLRCVLLENVVYDDKAYRAWCMDDTATRGLLYACKQGHFTLDKPFGVFERCVQEGQVSRLQVLPVTEVSNSCVELTRAWRAQAEQAWSQAGHPGWLIVTEPVELVSNSASQQQQQQQAPSASDRMGSGNDTDTSSGSPALMAFFRTQSPAGTNQPSHSAWSPHTDPTPNPGLGSIRSANSSASPFALDRLLAGGAAASPAPRLASIRTAGSSGCPSRSESPHSSSRPSPFATHATTSRPGPGPGPHHPASSPSRSSAPLHLLEPDHPPGGGGRSSTSSPGSRGRRRRNSGSLSTLASPSHADPRPMHILDLAASASASASAHSSCLPGAKLPLMAPLRTKPTALDLGGVESPKLMRSPKRDSPHACKSMQLDEAAGSMQRAASQGGASDPTLNDSLSKRPRPSLDAMDVGSRESPGTQASLTASPHLVLQSDQGFISGTSFRSPMPKSKSRMSPGALDPAASQQLPSPPPSGPQQAPPAPAAHDGAGALVKLEEFVTLHDGSRCALGGPRPPAGDLGLGAGAPHEPLPGILEELLAPPAAAAAAAAAGPWTPGSPLFNLSANLQHALDLNALAPAPHPATQPEFTATTITHTGNVAPQGPAPLALAPLALAPGLSGSMDRSASGHYLFQHMDSDSFRALLDSSMLGEGEAAGSDGFKAGAAAIAPLHVDWVDAEVGPDVQMISPQAAKEAGSEPWKCDWALTDSFKRMMDVRGGAGSPGRADFDNSAHDFEDFLEKTFPG